MKTIPVMLLAVIAIASCKEKTSEMSEGNTDAVKAFDIENINDSIKPCEDFWEFAVGNWMANNPVPPTESRWSSFNILDKQNRKKLENIILDLSKSGSHEKGSDGQLIADLYLSFMDTVQREKVGVEAIKPMLNMVNEIHTTNDLATVAGTLRTMGVSGPMRMGVGRDARNSSQYVVYAGQSGLTLPDKQFYLSDKEKFVDIREKYVSHVNKMFELCGMKGDGAGESILELETALAKIQWDRTKMREPELTYNKMSWRAFADGFQHIQIQNFLNPLGFASFDTLIVSQPSYFTGLDSLLSAYAIDQWKLYMTWRVVGRYGSSCTQAGEDESFRFFRTELRGIDEQKPRQERGVQLVNSQLGEPLGKFFVKEHFSESSKQYMEDLIENLRDAYRIRIRELTWMGDSTKDKALRKLEAFTYKIGYPNKWEDYSTIDIDKGRLVQNLVNCSIHGFKLMADKLGKPVDKDEWHMTPQTVNAYYSSTGNEVVFPAGILQPPFFHPSFDDAINYGGIGAVIGHEFTHGFDDKGSKSDWNGNLNNWWTDKDREQFEALTSKLAAQFSSYEPLPGMFIKGDMTLGENIADLGGLTLAYLALERKIGDSEIEKIDGFTWQQRFFLGWANVWKQTITEDELRNRLITDYHSPGEYRVKGPLSNLPQFKNAFGCEGESMVKSDSAMIIIW